MTIRNIVLWCIFWMLGGVQSSGAEPQSPPASQTAARQQVSQPSRTMVQQKLQLVKMMLSSSPVMQRASGSDDEALKKQVAEVLARYASANNALNGGEIERADKLADEVLSLLEEVSRQAPDVRREEAAQHARYDAELKGLQEAEEAYRDLRKRLGGAGSKASASPGERVRRKREDAQAFARDGRYREAADLLEEAHAEVVAALNKLLGSTALTHDLKFNTAAEEYEYELARYHSYEELAPIAYVELKPDEFTRKLSERYVQESRAMRDNAIQQAAQGRHREAIGTLSGAIKQMQTALRVLGLVLQE